MLASGPKCVHLWVDFCPVALFFLGGSQRLALRFKTIALQGLISLYLCPDFRLRYKRKSTQNYEHPLARLR
jgi:hypothetical protein